MGSSVGQNEFTIRLIRESELTKLIEMLNANSFIRNPIIFEANFKCDPNAFYVAINTSNGM